MSTVKTSNLWLFADGDKATVKHVVEMKEGYGLTKDKEYDAELSNVTPGCYATATYLNDDGVEDQHHHNHGAQRDGMTELYVTLDKTVYNSRVNDLYTHQVEGLKAKFERDLKTLGEHHSKLWALGNPNPNEVE